MDHPTIKVCIIILNWNNWQDTLACLEYVRCLDKNDLILDIIVIDNGSSDNSTTILRNQDDVVLIENCKNLGFAAGNNPGIKTALTSNCDFVMLLNNDTSFSPDLIQQLYKAIKVDKLIGIVCPKIIDDGYPGRIIYAGGKFLWPRLIGGMVGMGEIDKGQHNQSRIVDFAVGTCMFIRREVFEKIGYLDEDFFFYHEDVDFSIRTTQAGFKIIYEPEAIIIHDIGKSTKDNIPLQTYLYAYGRVIFFRKHIKGISRLFVFFYEIIRILRIIIRNIINKNPSLTKQYIKGILDGLTGIISVSQN